MSINPSSSSEDWPHLGLGIAQEGMWEGKGERQFPDELAAGKCLDPGKVMVLEFLPLESNPSSRNNACDPLVVTPRSRLEQHRPSAAGFAGTSPGLSAVCCLLLCFNPAANM